MTSVEIFSGAGGLAKGIEMAGARHLAFVEWNHDACNTLRANYGGQIVHEGDIREFDFSAYDGVDLIAGGPPCQPFSLGGKALGCDDSRDMFPAAIAAIRALMPRAFIFENVKGLLRKSFAEYFEYILLQLTHPDVLLPGADWRENLALLRDIGRQRGHGVYNVRHRLLNAADYGVPQVRERVFVVGLRSDLAADWAFPEPTHSREALLWEQNVTGDYWRRHNVEAAPGRKCSATGGQRQPRLKPWVTMRDALAGLGEPCGSGEHAPRDGARAYPGHTGSDIDWPSKTIKAGAHGVPGGENMLRHADGSVRYLTVLEAKRIQTFPDDYVVAGSWGEAMRQLGNAVPVRLAHAVGRSVIKALTEPGSAGQSRASGQIIIAVIVLGSRLFCNFAT